MKDLLLGASYIPRAFGQLLRPGTRRYVLLPILVNVLVFIGLFWLAADQFAALLAAWLPDPSAYSGEGAWNGFMRGLLSILAWLFWPIFVLAAGILMFYSFTVVANLLGSPFNGMLAARLERELSGGRQPPELPGQGIALEAAVSVATELRKLAYFALLALPLLALSAVLFFVPVVNLLIPFLWAAYGGWVMALEYMDYPMANHGYRFAEERALLRRRRGLAFGFGLGLLAMTLVPVLNLLAMPTGVIAATWLWHERLRAQSAG
ncbi:sulfate transporter CysZ [Alkalilimnicola sp. S0819]|uniref:sulfate transporter CysZ n=1 Tax=Alkalilimnicola sp. S0819 TaxID=2613922 RepID=UPI0012627A67|nr:sulfate transporter CysZ [Alkalilimnicola sp. S0819]KAB7628454.1 sulfate transporter CysZ [Alkalilimnicola sp. S0819]MPQ15361.1 sulfate transporter CysZ [Alkalilimnicola sp. S0819]